ncbi:MAG: hypothetical protein AB1453_03370 [Chloroflexota bacterium]
MYSLKLTWDGEADWVLHGPGAAAGLEGAQLAGSRQAPRPDWVIETILLALKGGGVADWIHGLERRLTQARAGAGRVHLRLQIEQRDTPLNALLLDGWLESLDARADERERGFAGLRLNLLREREWSAPAAALPLTNANGTGVTGGLALFNHADSDSGHQNFADIHAAHLEGSQPAPLSLRLALGSTPNRVVTHVILAAGSDLWMEGASFAHALEGESGSPGAGCAASSLIADSGASGGFYRRLEWSAAGEAALLRWTVTALALSLARGRAFRPVLRLHNPPVAGIYLHWRMFNARGGLLDRGGEMRLVSSRWLQPTPSLCLPPLDLPGLDPAGLTLELWAVCDAPGSRVLDVDFVHLLPVEGWLELLPLGGTAQGSTLVVDGTRHLRRTAFDALRQGQGDAVQVGCTYSLDAGGAASASHALNGGGLRLLPGRNQRLYLLFETDTGAPVNHSLQAQALYPPCWLTP